MIVLGLDCGGPPFPSKVPDPWLQISPSYDTAATGLEVEMVRLQNSVVDIQQYTGLRSKVKVVLGGFVRFWAAKSAQ